VLELSTDPGTFEIRFARLCITDHDRVIVRGFNFAGAGDHLVYKLGKIGKSPLPGRPNFRNSPTALPPFTMKSASLYYVFVRESISPTPARFAQYSQARMIGGTTFPALRLRAAISPSVRYLISPPSCLARISTRALRGK
jgi:hypothetical protein